MIADIESEDPITEADELESLYDGAEAMQCLRLSQKLFEARQENAALRKHLASLYAGFKEIINELEKSA